MDTKTRLHFWKYQGTGNDFVLVDNRDLQFPKDDVDYIQTLCDRRFGIGADGLILLENDQALDFLMVYYNADGKESSMCGNGGRCIVAFAKELGLIENKTRFNAIDGTHEAKIAKGAVELKMGNVDTIHDLEKYYFLDTGSPHHVQEVKQVDALEITTEGARIRYGLYGERGSNVNFVEQISKDTFKVRTYERGVEGETLSCGTGVTAVALAMHHAGKTHSSVVTLQTKGGNLKVEFNKADGSYTNVRLSGPATKVFEGQWQQ